MPPPQQPDSSAPTLTISPLATLQPVSTARTWQTAPHPTLPIVATACADRTVRVYSLTSFTLLHTISGGHKRSIRTVSWKPDNPGQSVLVTGSFDASAGVWRRWERGAGDAARDFTREQGSSFPGSDDGGDGGSEEEDEEEGEYNFSCILDGHESEIKSVAWNASGQYLATCSRDKSVWVWEELDDDNFETVAVLQEHEADVKCVAWHPSQDLLASASYDDTVRLYREGLDDWDAVAVLHGHERTVWWVEFEGPAAMPYAAATGASPSEAEMEQRRTLLEARRRAGPRLVSSSDDCTARIWWQVPREAQQGGPSAGGMPSILRSYSVDEEWVQEAVLPRRHDRAIYAVSWSRWTGMIVSAGSDGRIVVYKERWRDSSTSDGIQETIVAADAAIGDSERKDEAEAAKHLTGVDTSLTEWVVVAEIEGAHGVFEINHVCWALRCDKGKRSEDEEVILSTGDDGEVKVWTLEDKSSTGL